MLRLSLSCDLGSNSIPALSACRCEAPPAVFGPGRLSNSRAAVRVSPIGWGSGCPGTKERTCRLRDSPPLQAGATAT